MCFGGTLLFQLQSRGVIKGINAAEAGSKLSDSKRQIRPDRGQSRLEKECERANGRVDTDTLLLWSPTTVRTRLLSKSKCHKQVYLTVQYNTSDRMYT
jgi:hypothetical protein